MADGDGGGVAAGERVARLYELVRPHLDERQRRLLLGAEALGLGRGGIKAVAQATGVHPDTVARGVQEAQGRPEPRVRAPGGGRKKLAATDPGLVPALEALVDPATRGDPVSPLRWTCLSTRNLAGALAKAGHPVSDRTVARLLREQGYSLQGNAKVAEGAQHGDRDAQFRYIAGRAGEFMAAGDPVVSVDAKKKEKIGNFANGGAEWRPAGQPERVNVHDFPSDADGEAIPYGIYDLGANAGWVSVGTDHDTSAFAVQTLRRWWACGGSARYPAARRLLICADSGGSNAARARAWKVELARLAAQTGLEITCCHYPPGTSKWNKVEHRLFAQITRNWRGRPLTSHQAVVELISATTTTTGLTVHAELDTSEYPTGLRYTSKQVAALPIGKHDFHPDWNYTIRPEPHETPVPRRAASASTSIPDSVSDASM
jgi:transposase